jgi:hypothetical protein
VNAGFPAGAPGADPGVLSGWEFAYRPAVDVPALGVKAGGEWRLGSLDPGDVGAAPASRLSETACQVIRVLDELHRAATGRPLVARLATTDPAEDGRVVVELAYDADAGAARRARGVP